MSQETLAHEADIDRTYISSIERGVYATSIDVLERLAKALRVEASELLRVPTKTKTGDIQKRRLIRAESASQS